MQHIHRTTSTIFLKIFKKIISKQSNSSSGGKLKYSFRRLWLGSFKLKFHHIWLYLFNRKVRSILTICWFYILNFIPSSHHGLQRLPIGNDFGILFKTRLLHLAQMKNIPFVTYEFITRTKKLQQRSIFFPLLKAYRARRFLRRPTVKRHNFSSKISLIIVAGSHGWPLVVETVAGAILMSSFLPVWVTRSFLKFLKHFFFFGSQWMAIAHGRLVGPIVVTLFNGKWLLLSPTGSRNAVGWTSQVDSLCILGVSNRPSIETQMKSILIDFIELVSLTFESVPWTLFLI